MSLIQRLLTVAREYARAESVSLSTASYRAMADTKRLAQIEAGGDITTGRFEAVMRWFSANWPAGATWPADVPRPVPEIPAASPGQPENSPSLGVSSLTGPGANAGPAFPEAAE
jgi:hypothetical protein